MEGLTAVVMRRYLYCLDTLPIYTEGALDSLTDFATKNRMCYLFSVLSSSANSKYLTASSSVASAELFDC